MHVQFNQHSIQSECQIGGLLVALFRLVIEIECACRRN